MFSYETAQPVFLGNTILILGKQEYFWDISSQRTQ